MLNNKPNGKTTYFNTAQSTSPITPEMLHRTPKSPNVANPRKMIAIFRSFQAQVANSTSVEIRCQIRYSSFISTNLYSPK